MGPARCVLVCVLTCIATMTDVTTALSIVLDKHYDQVYENIPINTTLVKFTVTGEDANATAMDDDTSWFVRLTHTGNRYSALLKYPLDKETAGSHDFRFRASDKDGNTRIASFKLYVNDVNDNYPAFLNIPLFWTFNETRGNKTSNETYTVTATDRDAGQNGVVTYYMLPNTQSPEREELYNKTFSINATHGIISIETPVDYEQNSYYQFTVFAEDHGTPQLTSNTSLIIQIKDIQDTPPFYTRIPYRKAIDENVPIGTSVITVDAQDGDIGVPNKVNYTIDTGECVEFFEIDGHGNIQTIQEIDRDSGPISKVSGVCTLNVTAYEIQGTYPQYGINSTSTNVVIIINDLDDNIPQLDKVLYKAYVQENAPNDIPVSVDSGNIFVFDNDTDENAKFTLSLMFEDETDCTYFEPWPETILKEQTVLIRVKNETVLDYEKVQQFNLIIQATETTNATVVNTANVSISLIDVNDNNPTFPNNSYSLEIDENIKNFTSIGNITATDRDSNKNLTYTLSGARGSFFVDEQDGEIFTICLTNCSVDFDRETRDVYYITYVVTDQGGRSDSAPLEIRLLDKNDNAPLFDRNYIASIKENSTQYENTTLLVLQARDNDKAGTENSRVSYAIKDSTQQEDCFNLNNETGELFVTTPVDYEALNGSEIIVTVTATDHGDPRRSSQASVTIEVQDQNDNRPKFTANIFNGYIAEDQTSNETCHAHVGYFNAADNDGTAPNNEIYYYITNGADEKFSINSTSGQVFVQIGARLDREKKPNYTLTVMVIDRGASPLSATAEMSVVIRDVNDEDPTFTMDVFKHAVHENMIDGSTVIHCFADDEDVHSNLLYNITRVTGVDENNHVVDVDSITNYFAINDTNGWVVVDDKIDREVAKVVTLTIMVIDQNASTKTAPQNDTAEVRITILDVNDNDPEFENSHPELNMLENAQSPTILTTIHATDKDENRTIRYNITSVFMNEPSIGVFLIDDKTGVLKKTGSIDREQESDNIIVVTVEATDNGVPPRSSLANVTINILDFNDNAPVFNKSALANPCMVPEDRPANFTIFTVTATDRDIGPNANITYTIDSGDHGNFTIDPISGDVIVKNKLDRETIPTYVLYITAMDNPLDDTEQKSTSVTVTVSITDINDNPPVFSELPYHAAKPEDTAPDKIITSVKATDKDTSNNSKLSYNITSCNCTNPLFRINHTTGDIRVNMSLKDQVAVYELNVLAFDAGEPSLNGSTTVIIEVEDVNLHSPVVTNVSSRSIKVYECVRPGTIVKNFTYTDADKSIKNNKAHFNISTTESSSLIFDTFKVSQDGVLQTKTKLNANNHGRYTFQIQATDEGDPPRKSDPVTIHVEVLDINDNPPFFNKAQETYNVTENINATLMGTVTAIDEDKDAVNCYEIMDNELGNIFSVNVRTGTLTNTKELDFEAKQTYDFKIKVWDCDQTTNRSADCDNVTTKAAQNDTIQVHIVVKDTNDNPPEFVNKQMLTGMRRTTDINTPLTFDLKSNTTVIDRDSPANGIFSWAFNNNGTITASPGLDVDTLSGQIDCEDGRKHVFCISKNGSIINNKYFKEDMAGYFIVPVEVKDTAGADTASVTVYLIGDSQILVMNILDTKERVSQRKDDLLKAYSDVIGYKLVYDYLEDHKSESGVISDQSDLHFHMVDPATGRVLTGEEASRLLDTFTSKLTYTMRDYHVTGVYQRVQTQETSEDSSKTTYIMVAVIVALVVSNAIFIYVFLSVKQRYKRKLLAATISTKDKSIEMQESSLAIPGSNKYLAMSNPLLNASIEEQQEATYDVISVHSTNSLDVHDVDLTPAAHASFDRQEEKEMTMDMYTEDVFTPSYEGETPLDAALRLHEKAKSTENLIEDEEVDDDDNFRVNYGFDDFDDNLESSEI